MIDPIASLLGDWSVELNIYSIILRLLLTFTLSAVIGLERSNKRHSAGLRTFMVVSLATTVSMLLEIYLNNFVRPTFFIISATSILGVAIISIRSLFISSRNQIKGLTTAATLWTSGIIGLATGAGLYTVALCAFCVILCCLSVFPAAENYLNNRSNHFEIHLELRSSKYLQNFVSTIRKLGLSIDDIEKNPAYSHSGLSVYTISITIFSKELKKYKTHDEIIEALRSLPYIYHIEEMHA